MNKVKNYRLQGLSEPAKAKAIHKFQVSALNPDIVVYTKEEAELLASKNWFTESGSWIAGGTTKYFNNRDDIASIELINKTFTDEKALHTYSVTLVNGETENFVETFDLSALRAS